MGATAKISKNTHALTHSGVGIIVTPSKRHPKLARKTQQMRFLQIFWSETFVYLPFKVRSENSHIPPSTWLPHQLWYAHNTRLVLPTPTRFASCGCGSMLLTYNQRFWLVKLAVSQGWTCCDSQQVIITFLGWQIEPLAKRLVKNFEVQASFSKHAKVWINKKASIIDWSSQKPLMYLSLMAETLISLNQIDQILVSCPPMDFAKLPLLKSFWTIKRITSPAHGTTAEVFLFIGPAKELSMWFTQGDNRDDDPKSIVLENHRNHYVLEDALFSRALGDLPEGACQHSKFHS